MTDKPKIICICGSSKFIELMAIIGWWLERDEGAIVVGLHYLPNIYPGITPDHGAEAEGVADKMDKLHLRKIDLCGEVFVVDWDNYIGDSTAHELQYAESILKPIRFLSEENEMYNKLNTIINEAKK